MGIGSWLIKSKGQRKTEKRTKQIKKATNAVKARNAIMKGGSFRGFAVQSGAAQDINLYPDAKKGPPRITQISKYR